MSRLDEIKARADAATEGPWSAKEGFTSDPMIEVYCQTVFINPDLDGDPIQPEAWADAEFIAASREDVPWLVSEVTRLTAERDALAAQVARVEALAEEWERMAATAIDPDSREWLPACAATLRECLWSKMHTALAGSEADTTDVDVCSGDADCTSALHVHGCFADSAGPCTDPDEHQPSEQED